MVTLPFNLGIGGAVQTGYRYAWENGYELAVQIDGDGQHDPRAAAAVLGPVLAGEADMASARGSPATAGTARRLRRIGIRLFARVVSLDRPPEGHRHDLRLPGAEPPAGSRCSRATTRTTTPRSSGR